MSEDLKLDEEISDLTTTWETLRNEIEDRLKDINDEKDVEQLHAFFVDFSQGLDVDVIPLRPVGIVNWEEAAKAVVGDLIQVWVTDARLGRVLAINDGTIDVEIDGKKRVVYGTKSSPEPCD